MCALLNRRPFFPLLKLPPSAGTNAVNGVLPREGPPVAGTKAGQNPSRGNHIIIHSKTKKAQQSTTDKFTQNTLQAKWKPYKMRSSCLYLGWYLFISAVLLHSSMTELAFSVSLSLFCRSYLSGNKVCRQLSCVWDISCHHNVGDGSAVSLHTVEHSNWCDTEHAIYQGPLLTFCVIVLCFFSF